MSQPGIGRLGFPSEEEGIARRVSTRRVPKRSHCSHPWDLCGLLESQGTLPVILCDARGLTDERRPSLIEDLIDQLRDGGDVGHVRVGLKRPVHEKLSEASPDSSDSSPRSPAASGVSASESSGLPSCAHWDTSMNFSAIASRVTGEIASE
eukprot:scaffold1989_cov131-Pinguiococcus_pyrenoidosus.AAC.2